MRAVRRAHPLPPIPAEFRLTEIKGEVPVVLEAKFRR
jgi:hypothetical protein